jgi:hypothetical protein
MYREILMKKNASDEEMDGPKKTGFLPILENLELYFILKGKNIKKMIMESF